MKYLISTLLFTALFNCTSVAQVYSNAEDFHAYCDSSGLQFNMPNDYHITEVKKNRDLYYSFAVINADSSMEIRYTIWSLEPALKEYEASLLDSNSLMVHPNNIYRGRVEANALNMTGGGQYNVGRFPPDAVKKEFNADDGGSCFMKFNCEFGEGYEYGQFIYLHKDDVADVIVTFMSHSKDTHSDLMMAGFHSLRFK